MNSIIKDLKAKYPQSLFKNYKKLRRKQFQLAVDLCNNNHHCFVYHLVKSKTDIIQQLIKFGSTIEIGHLIIFHKDNYVHLPPSGYPKMYTLDWILRGLNKGETACQICFDDFTKTMCVHACQKCNGGLCGLCYMKLTQQGVAFKCPSCRSLTAVRENLNIHVKQKDKEELQSIFTGDSNWVQVGNKNLISN